MERDYLLEEIRKFLEGMKTTEDNSVAKRIKTIKLPDNKKLLAPSDIIRRNSFNGMDEKDLMFLGKIVEERIKNKNILIRRLTPGRINHKGHLKINLEFIRKLIQKIKFIEYKQLIMSEIATLAQQFPEQSKELQNQKL